MKKTKNVLKLVSVGLIVIWLTFLLFALSSNGVIASNQTQRILDDFLFNEGGIGIGHVFCADYACVTDHYQQHKNSSTLNELESRTDSGTVLLEKYFESTNTQKNDDISVKIALMDMLDERIYLRKLSFSQLLQLRDCALQEHSNSGRLTASTTLEIALRIFVFVDISFVLIAFTICSFWPLKKQYPKIER